MAKKALLVGINDYPGWGSDLNSCVEDIMAWRNLLMEKFNFSRKNIRLLLDSRATKDDVLERLEWLTDDQTSEGSFPDGNPVFIYSGHGTTLTEREGGIPDEAKDEALCLYGDGEESFLIDDELYSILERTNADFRMTIICDSCYSGDMHKNLPFGILDGRPKPKFLTPPPDISHRNEPFSSIRRFGVGLEKAGGLASSESRNYSGSKCVLVSACRETEVALAATEETNGLSVFTYFAIRAIKSFSALTPSQLIYHSANHISNAGYSQIPQLKGDERLFEQPLFG